MWTVIIIVVQFSELSVLYCRCRCPWFLMVLDIDVYDHTVVSAFENPAILPLGSTIGESNFTAAWACWQVERWPGMMGLGDVTGAVQWLEYNVDIDLFIDIWRVPQIMDTYVDTHMDETEYPVIRFECTHSFLWVIWMWFDLCEVSLWRLPSNNGIWMSIGI